MALAAFALNLNTNVMGALLPFLGGESGGPGLGQDEKAWLLSGAAWASAAGALVTGPIADRHGRRGLLVWGLGLFALASAAHVLAVDFLALLLLRVASGVAVGVAYACASAMIADLVPYGRRGAAMGLFTAGMFLAVPVGLPLAVLLARSGWWQAIFLFQAAVGVAAIVLVLRAVPRDVPAMSWVGPWIVLQRPGVMASLAATLLHVGSFFTTVQLAGDWLNGTGMLPRDRQGMLWVVLGLASAAGAVVFGRLGDRLGKRNFVLLGSVLLVACLLWLGRVDSLAQLWPAGVALAVVAAARTGPLQALVSGLAPRQEQATLMGLRAGAQQAGVGLFALAVAPWYSSTGFGIVVTTAVACQVLSYVAIRFGVREGG